MSNYTNLGIRLAVCLHIEWDDVFVGESEN